jgi:hypothetical protein
MLFCVIDELLLLLSVLRPCDDDEASADVEECCLFWGKAMLRLPDRAPDTAGCGDNRVLGAALCDINSPPLLLDEEEEEEEVPCPVAPAPDDETPL